MHWRRCTPHSPDSGIVPGMHTRMSVLRIIDNYRRFLPVPWYKLVSYCTPGTVDVLVREFSRLKLLSTLRMIDVRAVPAPVLVLIVL
jgi:hypothetical protein